MRFTSAVKAALLSSVLLPLAGPHLPLSTVSRAIQSERHGRESRKHNIVNERGYLSGHERNENVSMAMAETEAQPPQTSDEPKADM